MDDDLLRSGLVAADLDATPYPGNGITPDTGYSIPYYRIDGTTHPAMRRVRYTPAIAGQRYGQPSTDDLVKLGYPASDATLPYLNPKILGGSTWEQLSKHVGPVTWLLAEGEKKATAGGKFLLKPFIGIGGCNNALVNTSHGWRDLHPLLKQLFRPGDTVEVIFDGDVVGNPNVNYAAGTLRRVLLSLGINVVFVLLPNNMGLDDWLLSIPAPARQAQYAMLPRVTGEGFLEHALTLARALGLHLDEKWQPRLNEENILLLLQRHERYAGKLWFDCIKNRLYESVTGVMQSLTDAFAFNEGVWMQRIFSKLRPQMVLNTMMALPGHVEFTRNPVAEWLATLRWDGTSRIEKMFVNGWGVDDAAYYDVIGKNMMVSMVARALKPGCQVDTMTIFEGSQGIYKSKALEVLGGQWYVAVSDRMDNKDFKLTCHTGWIADVVELGSFKYSDFVAIKGVITGRTDSFRPPYGRSTNDYPRHFVLVGTTNDDSYLRDTTGNRRFAIVVCKGTINIDWIAANREQLFAEAYAHYLSGYEWWTEAPGAAAIQQLRMTFDPWDTHIDAILAEVMKQPVVGKTKPVHFIPAVNILTMLNVPRGQQNNGHFMRLRELMRARPDWERIEYNDPAQPVAILDDKANRVLVNRARGYAKIAAMPLPSATIIGIRSTPGITGSKF